MDPVAIIEPWRPWKGQLNKLEAAATDLVAALDLPLEPIKRNRIKHYRLNGCLTAVSGRTYTFRQLLEVICCALLIQESRMTVAEVAKIVPASEEQELIGLICDRVEPTQNPTFRRAKVAIRVLARGLSEHYEAAMAGQTFADDLSAPTNLQQAAIELARLEIDAGQPEHSTHLHGLVHRCTRPPREWGIETLAHSAFPYRDVVLFDDLLGCPTLECFEIAASSPDTRNVLEALAFNELNALCNQLDRRGDEAYTLIRQFVAEHPVSSHLQINEFVASQRLARAERFLSELCYQPAAEQERHQYRAVQCPTCGSPIRLARGRCAVRQCTSFDHPVESDALTPVPEDALVLRPHIALYWFGPALDEIRIYNDALQLGLEPQLYPLRDSCDVAIPQAGIGIDIKSYQRPEVLAAHLNQGLGGLLAYARRYVAINDRCWNQPDYQRLLNQDYRGPKLTFLSVTQMATKLREWVQ